MLEKKSKKNNQKCSSEVIKPNEIEFIEVNKIIKIKQQIGLTAEDIQCKKL